MSKNQVYLSLSSNGYYGCSCTQVINISIGRTKSCLCTFSYLLLAFIDNKFLVNARV